MLSAESYILHKKYILLISCQLMRKHIQKKDASGYLRQVLLSSNRMLSNFDIFVGGEELREKKTTILPNGDLV